MVDLFDTPEKKSEAALQFESLQMHLGWQNLVRVIKQNIEILDKQLKDGVPGQTIEDINRLRDKIKDHENFINTPANLIKGFTDEPQSVPNADPYYEVEDIQTIKT